jgi:hypothetical protein
MQTNNLPPLAELEYLVINALGHMFYAINGAMYPNDNEITVEANDDYIRSTVRDVVRALRATGKIGF